MSTPVSSAIISPMNIITEVLIELYTQHNVCVDANDIRKLVLEENPTKEELIQYFIDRDKLYKSVVELRK